MMSQWSHPAAMHSPQAPLGHCRFEAPETLPVVERENHAEIYRNDERCEFFIDRNEKFALP